VFYKLEMNLYYLLYIAIPICFLIALFLIPLVYAVYSRDYKKTFRFTWIIWSIALFFWELFLPGYASIMMKATGRTPDIMIAVPLLFVGVLIGWLPGLIFGAIAKVIHGTERNISSDSEEKK